MDDFKRETMRETNIHISTQERERQRETETETETERETERERETHVPISRELLLPWQGPYL